MDVRIIKNSKGQNTVEIIDDGISASVPSGGSKGKHEAPTVKPKKAVEFIKEYLPQLSKMESRERELYLQDHIKELGANTTLALSYYFFKRDGASGGNEFPYPVGNVAGSWKKNRIQEFLSIPLDAKSISEAIEINQNVWEEVGRHLNVDKKNPEGGWISNKTDEKIISIVSETAEHHGAKVGVDIAATHFWNGKKYKHSGKEFTEDEHFRYVASLINFYDLVYVEDPFHEDAFHLFSDLTEVEKNDTLIVGDDIFVTNPERLEKGIAENACNSVLIKPDQIGCISLAQRTVELGKENGYVPVISHRSGETKENILSDLALYFGTPLAKIGIHGEERESKLNRLKELWEEVKKPKMAKI